MEEIKINWKKIIKVVNVLTFILLGVLMGLLISNHQINEAFVYAEKCYNYINSSCICKNLAGGFYG